MKRLISVALALMLLLTVISGLALAEEKKWPERELTGTPVVLKPAYPGAEHKREQSFAGPSRRYALSGAFLADRVNKITALLREGNNVLVDLDYANSRRVVYFESESLVSADVQEEKLEGIAAKMTKNVYPVFYGPGKEYDIVTKRTPSRFLKYTMEELEERFWEDTSYIERILQDAIHWVGVDAGTPVTVFFETNGWLYVESSSTPIGYARFWVPADTVE